MSIRVAALLKRAIGLALFLSFIGASCGQAALGLLPGVVNDPHNLSLRRAIFDFGKTRMCSEVQKRSMPLKLREDDPVTGRFFPTSCVTQTLANEDLVVQFGGGGYVWTNLTQRMSFDAGGTVEYDTDFLMDGSTMYVYFRQKSTSAASFTVKVVEQPQALSMASIPLGGNGQSVANTLGAQILKSEIAKGFTVIRAANGDVEFGLGVVEKGSHPPSPHLGGSGKNALLNDRSEVHQNQRDFVGPIEIPDGEKLNLTLSVDGAPAIDVIVIPRFTGEQWLQQYTTQAATTPPPGVPLLDEAVFSGAIWRRTLSLPPGLYYVVLDNTPTAGRTAPPGFAHDDRAALVSYTFALGD